MRRQSKFGNERGQTAIMFTLGTITLFGMLGLVVDIGYAYYRKEAAQTAADAAAGAAAIAAYNNAQGGAVSCSTNEVSCYNSEYTCPSTPSGSNNVQVGCMYAQQNGFTTGGKIKVTFRTGTGTPPTATGAMPMNYWVEARVSENIPQLFSAVLGFPTATVTARATSATRVADSGGCVITLNPHASSSLRMTGNADLTSGCGVFVNSDHPSNAVDLNGGGTITTTGTSKTNIVGGCGSSCGNIHPSAITGAASITDPLEDLSPPTYSGCNDPAGNVNLGSHATMTLTPSGSTPMVLCNGINLGAQSSLTLNPGTYVVKGGISLGAQTSLNGSGVFIYVESGPIGMSGGASVNLSAPTTGTYAGVLFYQDRADTNDATLVGGNTQLMQGILYFPTAHLNYTGGSSTNARDTTIISDTLNMVGHSYIRAAANSPYTGITGGAFFIE